MNIDIEVLAEQVLASKPTVDLLVSAHQADDGLVLDPEQVHHLYVLLSVVKSVIGYD